MLYSLIAGLSLLHEMALMFKMVNATKTELCCSRFYRPFWEQSTKACLTSCLGWMQLKEKGDELMCRWSRVREITGWLIFLDFPFNELYYKFFLKKINCMVSQSWFNWSVFVFKFLFLRNVQPEKLGWVWESHQIFLRSLQHILLPNENILYFTYSSSFVDIHKKKKKKCH